MDFKHRIEFELDTGGGNWDALYRHLSPEEIGSAPVGRIEWEIGDGSVEFLFLDDAFVHLGGASYRKRYDKSALRSLLAAHIWSRHLPEDQPVLPLP